MVDFATINAMPNLSKPPKKRRLPRWIKVLAFVMGIFVLLRLLGVIEMPKEWLIAAIIFEVGVGLFELTIILIVFRYFYKKNRARGKTKLDAMISSEVDRARAMGAPEKLITSLERAARFELKVWGKIYRFTRRCLRLSEHR